MLKHIVLAFTVLAGCMPADEVTPRNGPADLVAPYPGFEMAVLDLLEPCLGLDDPPVTVMWTELPPPGPTQFWRLEISALSDAALSDCLRERLLKAGAENVQETGGIVETSSST